VIAALISDDGDFAVLRQLEEGELDFIRGQEYKYCMVK
jgi:hypothetical protein